MCPRNALRATKPRLGISSCLLGQRVRYDGQHKKDDFLTQTLGPFVEWVPVCPEVEVGMGVPREAIRLVGSIEHPRLIGERSQKDWTQSMRDYTQERVRQLSGMDLCGFILKKDSPSCGMERVRVYPGKGKAPNRNGRGLFAQVLLEASPLLPIEEEGRLNDPKLRDNFIERVFAYQRWTTLLDDRPSLGTLVAFHAAHKFVLMAHSEPHLRQLGRLVAGAKGRPLREALEEYGRVFMEALGVPATARKHVNVLTHLAGYFSKQLSAEERAELAETIADYHHGLVPLIVPITLIRHYVKKHRIAYIQDQVYLQPHPKELMLRNHV